MTWSYVFRAGSTSTVLSWPQYGEPGGGLSDRWRLISKSRPGAFTESNSTILQQALLTTPYHLTSTL